MVKLLLAGITFWATSLLPVREANALTPVQIPVMRLCPTATWTDGYYIGELIPLAQSQYKVGLVSNGPSNVRSGAGFESAVLFTLNTGEQVTVIGEAWDTGCNQWMRVMIDARLYWMHGDQLQLL